ncbi:MAG: amylo-alpha-1,6-glucosidase [Proteobacteria bacterium]|nr:MAG: amylo-alpha-1,6-glucosidase [Pseudomonadota bacterium]
MSIVKRDQAEKNDEEAGEFYIPATTSLAERRARTLKHGDTFALFDHYGDLQPEPGVPDGLYHEDTRFLSDLRLSIEGVRPLLLSSTVQSNNAVLDVDLTNPDLTSQGKVLLRKDTLHIARAKFLFEAGCYEVLSIRNFDDRRRKVRISIAFDADFADLFEVRGHTRTRRGSVTARVLDGRMVCFEYASLDGLRRTTELCFEPAPDKLLERRATFVFDLAPKARRAFFLTVLCRTDERPLERRFFPAMRRARHNVRESCRRAAAIETSNDVCNEVLCRSMADLSMLVTDTPHGPYPYAGIPWFSTAFGRDGLIAALQMLWADPAIARGVLRFLAAHQATAEDPASDAEPGKVLHETRKGELARLGEVPFGRYYGSIDATPLFVVLAGRYWRRTADRKTIAEIWPAVKAALAWIDHYGDCDGDGFVEYRRRSDGGLVNQGWKDSEDAVFHADGTLAVAPIALCEVQGYVYLARILAAQMAQDMGDAALAVRLREQARVLQEQFEERFWDEELGSYVLALDGNKQPCRVRTSNAGQLLFTGIASAERATRTARMLLGREFFTGWGIRTVGSREARFNPASYHNGSVWPHDNALIALGLARYGCFAELEQVVTGLFDAAAQMDLRRLPELFCGTVRRREKGPTLYPIACAPQAWAAGAPLALLEACFGLEIEAAERRVVLRHPSLPAFLRSVRIRNLAVADARLDLLLQRHDGNVAVNVLERRGGDAKVCVLL